MKRLIPLFLFLAFMGLLPAAAQRKMQEVIYLKNGSVIRNVREMQHADSLIRVTTHEGSVFLFRAGDLQKMTHEAPDIHFKEKGYLLSFDFGILSGRQHHQRQGWGWGNTYQPSANTFSFSVVNGYRFNRFAGVGLGFGFDTYQQAVISPVFVRGTGYLFQSRITPVYSLDAGYGFHSPVMNGRQQNNGVKYRYYGGFMGQVSGGVQVFMTRDAAMYLMAGYRLQDYRYEISSEQSESSVEQRLLYRRLSLSMGFVF